MDHLHHAQHELKVLVLRIRRATRATATTIHPTTKLRRPLGQLIPPFFRLLGRAKRMVLRKPRAHILKPGINVRLLHRIHQNLNRLGLGARKIMCEILLQPTQIRCRIRLLF